MSNPSLPITQMPTVLKTTAVEEDIEKLQFRPSRPEPAPGPQPVDFRDPSTESFRETSRSADDPYLRIGGVMKAMFPDGFQPRSEEDFAILHLFGRLVGNLTRFAHTGMKNQGSIHDVSVDAANLERLLVAQRNRK